MEVVCLQVQLDPGESSVEHGPDPLVFAGSSRNDYEACFPSPSLPLSLSAPPLGPIETNGKVHHCDVGSTRRSFVCCLYALSLSLPLARCSLALAKNTRDKGVSWGSMWAISYRKCFWDFAGVGATLGPHGLM